MKKVLILFAHPVYQTSLLNKSLLAALPNSSHVTLHDLYEVYPNFMIDVDREQGLLDDHDVVIFQHPLYWYSSPSILKEWMDLVLEHGYAYGTDADALKNKQFLSVVTLGGDVSNYQGDRNIRSLLQPFELTAKLCHMTFLPPFVTYSGLKIKAENFDADINDQYLSEQISSYQQLISDLTNDKIDLDQCDQVTTINEILLNPPEKIND